MSIPILLANAGTPWREKRPFLGAILQITAGVIVGYVPIGFSLELILIGGAFTGIGLVFGVFIFLTGVVALLRPDLSTILGSVGILFSILSFLGTLGGLFVGLFIGIVGGNLLIAWQPPDSQGDSGVSAADVTETKSSRQYSWQEDSTTWTADANAPTATKTDSQRITTGNGGRKVESKQSVSQASPYVRHTNTITEDTDPSGKGESKSRRKVTENEKENVDHQMSGGQAQRNLQSSINSTVDYSSPSERDKRAYGFLSANKIITEHSDEATTVSYAVDTRLEDALERVVHGAIISFPSILFVRGLSFATTSIITNGFGGSSYGLWVLAKKLVSFLRNPTSEFLIGLNRFLPTASNSEQDIFVTIASLLVLGPGVVFGAGLFLIAPHITQAFDYGQQFQLFVRIYAVWFPGSLWLQTINAILKSLEEVEAFNFLFRFVFPLADLAAVGVGAFLFHNFIVIVLGQVLIAALVTFVITCWLIWRWEFIPRVRGAAASRLRSRYVRFSLPLVGRKIVNTINAVGFFLLIPLFLTSIAAGVLAVGGLISSLVRLPLVLNNQFMNPVVADLHEHDHQDALVRLYQVTTRLILVGSLGLAIPLLVYRGTVMSLFGPVFVEYTALLPVFILAKFIGTVPGSDGIILQMTDRQRAVLVIDIVTALLIVTIAIPLTMQYGLWGLVMSFLAKATVSNGLQLLALYNLNGYHPFTRLHVAPLLAAVPFLVIAFAGKLLLSGAMAPLIGTLVGVAVYGGTLHILGFTTTERRLAMFLLVRYRRTISQFLRKQEIDRKPRQ